ncbi:IS6 family transposase [Hellea sp.]|nr:IS6 family transposase [Hellea sp.]
MYPRHCFHPVIIRRVVWMYFRFNLSFHDNEDVMAKCGIDVSYETIIRWINKLGLQYTKRIKRTIDKPSTDWHLDEVYTKISGKMVYLWRAVDDEGTMLDIVVQSRRNTKAALGLLRKVLTS